MGIGYPVALNATLGFRLSLDNPAPLAAGMTFHLPIRCGNTANSGLFSQTIVITNDGAEALAGSPATLALLP